MVNKNLGFQLEYDNNNRVGESKIMKEAYMNMLSTIIFHRSGYSAEVLIMRRDHHLISKLIRAEGGYHSCKEFNHSSMLKKIDSITTLKNDTSL